MDRLTWADARTRPALLPAVFLAAGVGLVDATASRAGLFLGLAALLWALGGVAWKRTGAYLAVLGAFALAGAGLSALHRSPALPPEVQAGGPVTVDAVVERVDRLDDATRLRVQVTRVQPGGPARFRAALTTRGHTTLLPGQRVLVPTRLRPAEGPGNPGEPDFGRAWRARGMAFTGSFDADRVAVLEPAPLLARWRKETVDALSARTRQLAPDEPSAALLLTLAAGERAALGDALEEQFARSGLAHVLSVSGLHVAVLALSLLAGARWLLVRLFPRAMRRCDARRWAAPLSLPIVWAYVLFTGSQPPAVRSAVMTTAVLGALVVVRHADALNALCLAALTLLVWDPAGIFDLSLQLSFLSVGSLLVLGPAVREALPVRRPDFPPESRWERLALSAREAVLGTLCSSVAVVVATLPWVASSFGRVSLAGLVSNVVCLPLGSLLTLFAAGGAALFVVARPLATPVLGCGAWLSKALVWAAELFARAPGASVPVPAFTGEAMAVFALGLVGWALLPGRARWMGLAAPLALGWTLVVAEGWVRREPALEVTFLAVGQGDAVVLSSAGRHALVDGGGAPGGSVGRRHVLPYLRHRGIRRLDFAALSHPHPDHGLGLVEVLQALPAAEVWLAGGTSEGALSQAVTQAARGARVRELERGAGPFRLGEATVEVLGPPADRELLEGVNDRSLVLLVRHGEVSVLLTGDLEEAGEEVLELSGPVTVMKAPHHGSRTSSGAALLARALPRYAVFCVGRHNRFGFPHPEVWERYRTAGASCFRTDLDGAVTFRSDGRNVEVETFRQRSKGERDADRAPDDDDRSGGRHLPVTAGVPTFE